MRLLHYTLSRLTIILFCILSVWAFIFYRFMIDEINDETDNMLSNYKEHILRKFLIQGDDNSMQEQIMGSYKITPIPKDIAKEYSETYIDTVIYVDIESEYEPARALKTTFMGPDEQHYELIVLSSVLEKEDLIETIWWSVLILYIILLISIIWVSEWVLKRSMQPLYKLLQWLSKYTLGRYSLAQPLNNETRIKEFSDLNKSISEMTLRNEKIYQSQKQFIGNASHELQTPLAVCINKIELLSEMPECTEKQLSILNDMYETLQRTVRMNKSLLLLSRIENNQFPDTKEISINDNIKLLLQDFSEIYDEKEIIVNIEEKGVLKWLMNETLSSVLLSNLLKNAFVHTPKKGEIKIIISSKKLTIANNGFAKLDENKIFSRFYKDENKKESAGLGLSIVSTIAALYNLNIKYSFHNDMHQFEITFPK